MEAALQKPVKTFMKRPVVAVDRGDSIKHCFALMDKHGILGVPVLDEDRNVVGILTETDLIRHFTTLPTPHGVHLLGSLVYLDDPAEFNRCLKDHCAETAGEIMTSPVITLSEDALLKDAIDRMATHHISRLPVVDGRGKLAGIITRSDIVHQLAQLPTV